MRAVHLEMVSDLTSEAFIACLHRFVLTEVALIKFGVITGLTLWAQTANLRDFNDFYLTPFCSIMVISSIVVKILIGDLSQKGCLILEDCGSLL